MFSNLGNLDLYRHHLFHAATPDNQLASNANQLNLFYSLRQAKVVIACPILFFLIQKELCYIATFRFYPKKIIPRKS